MRTRWSLSLVLALFALPALAQDRAADFETQVAATAEASRARTVLVVGVVGMGSGAVITPRGRVITNAHVVAGARYALCRWSDGEQRLMRRLGIDYAQDLALLEPADAVSTPLPCFAWRGSAPREGDWVIGLGHPGGYRGDDWAVASLGQITGASKGNRVNGVFDYDGALRSDTPIFSGNSGGPLVDLQGRLVGLNGAADIMQASALTIPEARIKARLDELEQGWILLPTGARLNPQRTPLLGAFYRATDKMARQLPERVMSQAQGAPTTGNTPPETRGPSTPGFAKLAQVAAASPRQGRLRAWLGAKVAGLRPLIATRQRAQQSLTVTPIDPRHAVTPTRLEVGTTLTQGNRRFRVVARSEVDDLTLLKVEGQPLSAVTLAPARPVGSLIHALDAEGVVASGIVSSRARKVGSRFLQGLRSGGEGPLGGAVEGIRRLIERLGLKPLSELLEQIDQAQEMRDAFAGGTAPRPYAWVLSVDAPLSPAQLGGPVVDRLGRLVGVSVGIAHHGTTFVVPWTRIWRAFKGHLAAPPTKKGALRLY